jgi:two-component system, LytTR family, response regulator
MRVVIVDDEPLARRELRRLLAEFAWIDIVGEAANAGEAAPLVDRLLPDLMFLDIQMPGGTGFDLLERLEQLPLVVFTTAYDEHAVRAFEVNALDYLLKPIEPQRLAAALARAQATAAGVPTAPATSASTLERLFLRDGNHCWFVPLREVKLFTAEGNYVRLSWDRIHPLLGRPLSSLEPRLDPRRFFRANRQQIINLDYIESVDLGVNGRLHVQLRDGPEVQISRRQARLFRLQASI